MSGQGWLKLHKSIQGHWIWSNAEYLKAWIDLIFLADHQQRQVAIGDEIIELQPGVVYLSKSALAARWGWDWKKTDKFLKLLEEEQMCIVDGTTHGTTISLVNWAKYQLDGRTKGEPMENQWRTDGEQKENRGEKDDPIYITNNNLLTFKKESKEKTSVYTEEKESKEKARFKPPTIDEVRSYCEERNNGIDAEAFIAFYESKGWKVGNTPMKSWKAAMVTWEKRHKTDQVAPPQKKSRFRNYEERDIDYEALFGGQGC